MGNRNESAKVLQTKHLLASQLMELLKNRSLKKISVNDICQGALISRSTFYLHFEDKYRLLQYCFEKEIGRWETSTRGKTAQETILYILDAILGKKEFYYHTFMDEPVQEQIEILHSVFARIFMDKLREKEKAGYELPGPASIVSAFYAGGIATANIQWIRSNFDIPKEEMAECQRKLLSAIFP